jgi:hypothetical protein
MDIIILNRRQARLYLPEKKTYAIRINNSYSQPDIPLQNSPNYIGSREYFFDDIGQNIGTGIGKICTDTFYKMTCWGILNRTPIKEETAKRIINDFLQFGFSAEQLMVHCSKGKGRSPAVALALSDIFHLGLKREIIERDYPRYNRFVYKTILNAAK